MEMWRNFEFDVLPDIKENLSFKSSKVSSSIEDLNGKVIGGKESNEKDDDSEIQNQTKGILLRHKNVKWYGVDLVEMAVNINTEDFK